MIYTLTLNPSLDYIVTVDDFKIGATNRTSNDFILPGGKGINVSIVLQNLGQQTHALGFLAGFTGKALQSMVEEAGIKADFLWVKKGDTRINVKLRSKEETEINGRGPEIEPEDLEGLYAKLKELDSKDILVISGSIPNTIPQTLYRNIMAFMEGQIDKIVVDATKDLLLNVLPYHPFLIKPNIHELEELFHKELTTPQEVIEAAKALQQKGARNVLVSMGGKGALLVDENGQTYQAPAPKGVLRNSVGAGDSMVAGFLHGYLETHNYAKAFAWGVCTGSASAFSEALATKPEVEALLEANQDLFKYA